MITKELLLVGAIVYVIFAILLLIRLFRGPRAVDRLCAADALDLITATALVLYSLYCGRGIYLDIAFVVAILGFVSTVFVSWYLEGRKADS